MSEILIKVDGIVLQQVLDFKLLGVNINNRNVRNHKYNEVKVVFKSLKLEMDVILICNILLTN